MSPSSGSPYPNVVVLGAGTMGTAIAALLFDAGFPVTLVDTSDQALRDARQRLKMGSPALLDFPERADAFPISLLAEAGAEIARAEWVIEAIVENLEAKIHLLRSLPGLRPDVVISSNTSALPITEIARGAPEILRDRVIGLHFFNPPRQLALVEVVTSAVTAPDVRAKAETWLDKLARITVVARDVPGFIANRIGIATLLRLMSVAERARMTIEETDAYCGPFLGRPRSGVYRLADRIGLDLLRDLALDLRHRTGDAIFTPPPSLDALVSRGWLGDKTNGGYTRRESKDRLVLDLTTMAYRNANYPPTSWDGSVATRVVEAAQRPGPLGELLRDGLKPTLDYALAVAPLVAEDPSDVDLALTQGFGWSQGPLALLADLGGPPAPPEKARDAREVIHFPVTTGHGHATLEDADGVGIIRWSSKLGILSAGLVDDLHRTLDDAGDSPLVVVGAGENFSAGYDIRWFEECAQESRFTEVELALARLQELAARLEGCNSVAAISGVCLGGGFEIALGCRRIVAQRDARIGLPEARLGLIPAGGGSARMRRRNSESAQMLAQVAHRLIEGYTPEHAPRGRVTGYLLPTDTIAAHPRRVLFEALALARSGEAPPPIPWTPTPAATLGMIDRPMEAPRGQSSYTEYDRQIAQPIRTIFAKCESFEDALSAERVGFLELLGKQMTRVRLRHMIEHKTPLRN